MLSKKGYKNDQNGGVCLKLYGGGGWRPPKMGKSNTA
jgi:hypothetical protein